MASATIKFTVGAAVWSWVNNGSFSGIWIRSGIFIFYYYYFILFGFFLCESHVFSMLENGKCN